MVLEVLDYTQGRWVCESETFAISIAWTGSSGPEWCIYMGFFRKPRVVSTRYRNRGMTRGKALAPYSVKLRVYITFLYML